MWGRQAAPPWCPSTKYSAFGQIQRCTNLASKLILNHTMAIDYKLEGLIDAHPFYGFPILNEGILVGYITRERLRTAIGEHPS